MQLLCMQMVLRRYNGSSTDHMVGSLIHSFWPNAEDSEPPETKQTTNGEGDTRSIPREKTLRKSNMHSSWVVSVEEKASTSLNKIVVFGVQTQDSHDLNNLDSAFKET